MRGKPAIIQAGLRYIKKRRKLHSGQAGDHSASPAIIQAGLRYIKKREKLHSEKIASGANQVSRQYRQISNE